MHYVLISGSHRPNSQSFKITEWLSKKLEENQNTTDIISLSGNPFPFWDESFWNKDSELTAKMQPTIARIAKADGYIIVSPEWSGMAPSGLKNIFLYLDSKTVGHKPALLVSVSAGNGGSYPIAELRMSSYKNTKINYIPDHLIIRNCRDVMNSMEPNAEIKSDIFIQDRAKYTLNILEIYTKAFVVIRENENLQNEKYEYGM